MEVLQGSLVSYMYHVDQPKGLTCGEDWPYNTRIEANKWYNLTMFVRVNTGGAANGLLKIWLNSGAQARLKQSARPGSKFACCALACRRLQCDASPRQISWMSVQIWS
jgi:hypothetical protein